jgi:hypothetical protein
MFSAIIPQSEPRMTHKYTLLSHLRLGSSHLNHKGAGWPSYSPRHKVPFLRLLRHAKMRWKYSKPPPRGDGNSDKEIVNLITIIAP